MEEPSVLEGEENVVDSLTAFLVEIEKLSEKSTISDLEKEGLLKNVLSVINYRGLFEENSVKISAISRCLEVLKKVNDNLFKHKNHSKSRKKKYKKYYKPIGKVRFCRGLLNLELFKIYSSEENPKAEDALKRAWHCFEGMCGNIAEFLERVEYEKLLFKEKNKKFTKNEFFEKLGEKIYRADRKSETTEKFFKKLKENPEGLEEKVLREISFYIGSILYFRERLVDKKEDSVRLLEESLKYLKQVAPCKKFEHFKYRISAVRLMLYCLKNIEKFKNKGYAHDFFFGEEEPLAKIDPLGFRDIQFLNKICKKELSEERFNEFMLALGIFSLKKALKNKGNEDRYKKCMGNAEIAIEKITKDTEGIARILKENEKYKKLIFGEGGLIEKKGFLEVFEDCIYGIYLKNKKSEIVKGFAEIFIKFAEERNDADLKNKWYNVSGNVSYYQAKEICSEGIKEKLKHLNEESLGDYKKLLKESLDQLEKVQIGEGKKYTKDSKYSGAVRVKKGQINEWLKNLKSVREKAQKKEEEKKRKEEKKSQFQPPEQGKTGSKVIGGVVEEKSELNTEEPKVSSKVKELEEQRKTTTPGQDKGR